MESVVITPKETGISDSKQTCAKPLLHSPATKSKCGVPPRITAPIAIMASCLPFFATFFAAKGNSYAPEAIANIKSAAQQAA